MNKWPEGLSFRRNIPSEEWLGVQWRGIQSDNISLQSFDVTHFQSVKEEELII